MQFVSYPKSGRSWVRYALTTLDVADRIRFHHDGFEFNDRTRPPHDFSLERRLEAYGPDARIVYLTRDPRDIMVSLFHQITGRYGPVFQYRGTLSEFIRDPYFGAENLRGFRAIWDEICARGRATRISYEAAHADFPGVLRRVSDAFDLGLEESAIQRAAEAAAFEEMKRIEQSRTFPKNWLKPKNGSPKVRRGTIGGHAEDLDATDIAYLNAVFGL
ncbi:MAG: sulfotransferase [Litorimonas sp.]